MPNYGGNSGSAPRFTKNTSGSKPRFPDLIGSLIMLNPASGFKWEMVRPYVAKGAKDDPAKPDVERLTADTVVLDGPHTGELADMWWGHTIIRDKAHKAEASGDIVLGRLVRTPKKAFKQWFPDEAAIERAFADPTIPDPATTAYVWNLIDGDTREADEALATNYLEMGLKAIQDVPQDDEVDPFGDDS